LDLIINRCSDRLWSSPCCSSTQALVDDIKRHIIPPHATRHFLLIITPSCVNWLNYRIIYVSTSRKNTEVCIISIYYAYWQCVIWIIRTSRISHHKPLIDWLSPLFENIVNSQELNHDVIKIIDELKGNANRIAFDADLQFW